MLRNYLLLYAYQSQRLASGHAFGKVPMIHAVGKIPMNAQNCTDMGATWRNFRKDQPPPKLLPRHYDSSLLAHLAHSTAGFCMAGLLSVSGALSTWASHADSKIQQLCPNLASSPFISTHIGQPCCWLAARTAEVRKALNPRPVQLRAGSLGFCCSSDGPLGLLALFSRMMTAS